MRLENVYFITGNAYAGKPTITKFLADKYHGILCEENYHDRFFEREDCEKQFLYQLIMEEPDPEKRWRITGRD